MKALFSTILLFTVFFGPAQCVTPVVANKTATTTSETTLTTSETSTTANETVRTTSATATTNNETPATVNDATTATLYPDNCSVLKYEIVYTLQNLVRNEFRRICSRNGRVFNFLQDCTVNDVHFKSNDYYRTCHQIMEIRRRDSELDSCYFTYLTDVQQMCAVKVGVTLKRLRNLVLKEACFPLVDQFLPCVFYHMNVFCPYSGEILKLFTFLPYYFIQRNHKEEKIFDAHNPQSETCMGLFDMRIPETYNKNFMEVKDMQRYEESEIGKTYGAIFRKINEELWFY
ncbi:unnamed protein product [Bursaphelenchus xylophilus]|uniref:(pine wood nematode) hypothetical protein n=1 Tax=Bursaphelenchus xylophilus TaxID=6326 RepID=A0A1I7RMS9_BURXY|nr:unnamed protein product [Bursaphelenchus xylophilus]CAG9125506.1 unnamed protein product [Bursaphelenchus xylophilus]